MKLMTATEVECKMVQMWCAQGTISREKKGHHFCSCAYTGKVYKTRHNWGSDTNGKESNKGSNACGVQVRQRPYKQLQGTVRKVGSQRNNMVKQSARGEFTAVVGQKRGRKTETGSRREWAEELEMSEMDLPAEDGGQVHQVKTALRKVHK